MDDPYAPAASPDFDWNDDSVVIRRRQAVAIYENGDGELVILQEALSGDTHPDGSPADAVIVISRHSAREFLRGLRVVVRNLGKPQNGEE